MRTKLRPTREDAKEKVEVYANLDKLIEEPLRFTLNEFVHELKPVTTEEFYKLVNSLVQFNEMSKKEGVKSEEVIDAFTGIFSSICSTITRKDVAKMNKIQIGALYQLVMNHAYGRSHEMTQDELKKKTMVMYQT